MCVPSSWFGIWCYWHCSWGDVATMIDQRKDTTKIQAGKLMSYGGSLKSTGEGLVARAEITQRQHGRQPKNIWRTGSHDTAFEQLDRLESISGDSGAPGSLALHLLPGGSSWLIVFWAAGRSLSPAVGSVGLWVSLNSPLLHIYSWRGWGLVYLVNFRDCRGLLVVFIMNLKKASLQVRLFSLVLRKSC